jgi:ribosome-binding protein aMBF1 (putative translation factor)
MARLLGKRLTHKIVFTKGSHRDLAGVSDDDAEALKRNVGNHVAIARERAGLTQAAFAEKFGMSVTYVQRIERGAANLTLESLVKLARMVRTPVARLLAPTPRQRRTGRPPR